MEEIYYPSSDKVHTVHACIWRPEGEILGVLQIIHGMEEYAARYDRFAQRAAKSGFLVCAEDHLGHGLTAGKNLGEIPKGGEEFILQDISALAQIARGMAQGKPYFVLGHSMGSFFCRAYIACTAGIDGAIIMGTGYKGGALLALGGALARLISAVKSASYKSPLLRKLAFGAYNRRFAPAATGYEWLSAEEENVKNYVADSMCGFGFTCSGYAMLFSIMAQACKGRTFLLPQRDMPVFIVSGKDDPVGDYGRGVEKVCALYKKSGASRVSIKLYGGARHEILNDVCAQEATDDILAFLADVAGRADK